MTSQSLAAGPVLDGSGNDPAGGEAPVGRAAPNCDIEALYRSGRVPLTRAIARRTGDRDCASDLVQDAFLRLARVPEATAMLARPHAYLRRIAVNLAKDLGKTRAARSAALHVVADDTTLPSFDPHAQLESRDMLRRVEAAMQRLPCKTREIFIAHRVEGRSYAEIAERQGLTIKGVEKQMAKAIVHLDRVMSRR